MSIPTPRRQTCPDLTILRQLLNDESSANDTDALREHIKTCPGCRQAMKNLGGGLPGAIGAPASPFESTLLGEHQAPAKPPLSGPAALALAPIPGYEVLGAVGRGGMGV